VKAADVARRRERLASAQGGICPWCSLPLPDDLAGTEVDHIIPRVRGGPNVAWNWQLVHWRCNRAKRFMLTDRALALAAEHGITLRKPEVRHRSANRIRGRYSIGLLSGDPLLFGGEPESVRAHYRELIERQLAAARQPQE
jgi:hypothetical protein